MATVFKLFPRILIDADLIYGSNDYDAITLPAQVKVRKKSMNGHSPFYKKYFFSLAIGFNSKAIYNISIVDGFSSSWSWRERIDEVQQCIHGDESIHRSHCGHCRRYQK